MLKELKVSDFVSEQMPPQESLKTKAAEKWFWSNVENGERKPFAEVFTITPEMASVILARNPENRKMSDKAISTIASDIKHNLWSLNGETIIVSNCGHLNDGQTRLAAIIAANAKVETFVVFGVERKARMSTDIGRARTVGNLLGMAGVPSSTRAAVVAASLIRYERGILNDAGPAQPTKMETVRRQNLQAKVIEDAIRFVSRKSTKKMRADNALAVAYIVIKEVAPPESVNVFFEKLCAGAGYEIGSPIHVTRTRLEGMISMTTGQKVAMVLSGWNAHRQNRKKIRTLQFRNDYPAIED